MSTKFRGAVLCAARMSVVRWEGRGGGTSEQHENQPAVCTAEDASLVVANAHTARSDLSKRATALHTKTHHGQEKGQV